jgi:hypothetical protein
MNDLPAIILSIMSLAVSLLVAQRVWNFNELSTRRASRETHARMLFDIGKALVDWPELWTIYDTHPLAATRDMSPSAVAKREAFVYQHLNVFEMVRDYYITIIRRDRVDEEYWQSWHVYMRQFFTSSSDARRLFAEQRTQDVFSKSFVEYANGLISGAAQNGPKLPLPTPGGVTATGAPVAPPPGVAGL